MDRASDKPPRSYLDAAFTSIRARNKFAGSKKVDLVLLACDRRGNTEVADHAVEGQDRLRVGSACGNTRWVNKFTWSMISFGATPQYTTVAGCPPMVSWQLAGPPGTCNANAGAGTPSCNTELIGPNPLAQSW